MGDFSFYQNGNTMSLLMRPTEVLPIRRRTAFPARDLCGAGIANLVSLSRIELLINAFEIKGATSYR